MALFLAVCGGALFGAHRIVEIDLFQQIAVGRAILLDPGSIGRSDFLDLFRGYSYVADKWLASVLVAVVDRLGGESALIAYQAAVPACVAAAWFLMLRVWGGTPAISLLGVSLALVACGFRLEPRPGTLGLILLALLLALVRAQASFARAAFLVPAIFVVWVNLHGYFVVGLLVLGAAVTAVALGDPTGPFAVGVRRSVAMRRAAIVMAAAAVACCVHPQGFGALAWPFRQLAVLGEHGYLREAVLEFRPTSLLFQSFGTWRWLALAIALLAAVGIPSRGKPVARIGLAGLAVLPWLILPPPGLVPWPHRVTFALWLASSFEVVACLRARRVLGPLLWLGASALAVAMVRNLTLVPPIALLLLVPAWTHTLDAIPVARRAAVSRVLACGFMVLVVWARLADHLPPGSYRSPGWTGLGIDRATLPVEAADFIERQRLEGKLLNHFDNGGYLLYRFHPRRRVFIAGNTSMYPPEFFRAFHREVIGRNANPDRLVQEYGVRVAVLDHASAETRLLVGKLVGNRAWRLVYLDRAAAVFVVVGPDEPSGELPPEVDLDRRGAELIAELDDESFLPRWLGPRHRAYPAANLGWFLRSAGRPRLALQVFEGLLGKGAAADLTVLTAETAEQAGDLPAVIPYLEHELARGVDTVVQSWLARALYVRGVRAMADADPARAEQDLRRSAALAPDEPGPQLALARLIADRGEGDEAARWLRSALELAQDESVRAAARADPILAPLLRE